MEKLKDNNQEYKNGKEVVFIGVDAIYIEGPFNTIMQAEAFAEKCYIESIECFKFRLEGEILLIPGPDLRFIADKIYSNTYD